MKKKILIHIGSLQAGGAEKSLVSFLNLLPKDKYEIDLLVFKKGGLFEGMLPAYINVIEVSPPYSYLSVPPTNLRYYLNHSVYYWFKKVFGIIYFRVNYRLSSAQALWKFWKHSIDCFPRKYDVAISYLEGITNYYVLDKVTAQRKLIWIHNEYDKLRYAAGFDNAYFRRADAIVTISETCARNLIKHFPDISQKIHILENITNSKLVRELADSDIITDKDFHTSKELTLLSVGRLYPQKNYPLAIRTAVELVKRGISFDWFIIGEGPLRRELESFAISLNVSNCIHFIGLRSNPYPYMKKADVIVMTSLFEGKSIVVDETKILCKPIVSTNYTTVYDNIQDCHTGIITEMNPIALADGIMRFYSDVELRDRVIDNLRFSNIDNTDEILKYVTLIEG